MRKHPSTLNDLMGSNNTLDFGVAATLLGVKNNYANQEGRLYM